jgi:hypothetical protein
MFGAESGLEPELLPPEGEAQAAKTARATAATILIPFIHFSLGQQNNPAYEAFQQPSVKRIFNLL